MPRQQVGCCGMGADAPRHIKSECNSLPFDRLSDRSFTLRRLAAHALLPGVQRECPAVIAMGALISGPFFAGSHRGIFLHAGEYLS
jgi:hypothetical protein